MLHRSAICKRKTTHTLSAITIYETIPLKEQNVPGRRIVFIMSKMHKLEQKQLWLSRISDLAESGLTQIQWANQKDISVSTLRYWIRKLREPEENESQNWLQVEIPQGSNIANLPLSRSSENLAEIKITCGPYTVEFPANYPMPSMADILRLIKTL